MNEEREREREKRLHCCGTRSLLKISGSLSSTAYAFGYFTPRHREFVIGLVSKSPESPLTAFTNARRIARADSLCLLSADTKATVCEGTRV